MSSSSDDERGLGNNKDAFASREKCLAYVLFTYESDNDKVSIPARVYKTTVSYLIISSSDCWAYFLFLNQGWLELGKHFKSKLYLGNFQEIYTGLQIRSVFTDPGLYTDLFRFFGL